MKEKLANKMGLMGAGVGIALYAIMGLMPGVFVGGVVGLQLAGLLLGMPVEATVIARIIVAVSMLGGALISGLMFILGSASVAWLVGFAIENVTGGTEEEEANLAMRM